MAARHKLRTGVLFGNLHAVQVAAAAPPVGSSRAPFDYWFADGELSPAPPHNVDSGGFDYWHADGELPDIQTEAA